MSENRQDPPNAEQGRFQGLFSKGFFKNSLQTIQRSHFGHAVCLLASLVFSLVMSAPFACAMDYISLEGRHPFSPGDDPSWASPSFVDTHWKRVKVPGDLKAQGIQQKPGVAWYRIHFRAGEAFRGQQAGLSLGNIGNADEVYLNGVRIGGEGIIGNRFVEAPWKERVYRIPAGLLRIGENNVLTVRFLDTYRMAGIFDGPVRLGDYRDLFMESRELEFMRKGFEIAFFTLLFFFLLISMFLMAQKVNRPDYRAFALFLGLYMALFILESLYVYDAGLKSPLVQNVIFAITCLLPAAGLFFVVNLYPQSRELWINSLMGASVVLSIALLFSSGLEAYGLFLTLFTVLAALTGGTALFLTTRSFLLRRPDSGPVLLGTVGLIAGLLVEFTPIGGNWHAWPIAPGDLGMAFLLITMAYALMGRYGRSMAAVKALSGRILEAHEEERKRLSRNIHDGLGQFLPMLKLQLQMLGARARSGDGIDSKVLNGLVSEISRAIVDLRHMIADIRPEFFEKTFLIDILKWYGQQFSERTGIDVSIQGPRDPIMASKIRENLYRIVQEALQNVEKHARAHRVEIDLTVKGKHIILKIRDDGKGFNAVTPYETNGIGLLSMRERAELLGGAFRLQSAPGEECTVEVEVPIP